MSKTKLNYSLSKNEFILIAALIFIATVALSLTYLVLPQFDIFSNTLQQYNMQESTLENIKAEYTNLNQYQVKDSELKSQLEELQNEVPLYLSEEEILSLLDKVSAESKLKLSSISYSGVTTETKSTFLASLKLSSSTTGSVSGAASQGNGTESYVSSERISLSFEGTYDDFYQFLTTMESEARQVYFRNVVLSRSEDGIIAGSLTMLIFSSSTNMSVQNDPNYPGYDYNTPEMPGKTNPFVAFAGYETYESTDTASDVSTPDFYAIVNSYDDNSSKILMGKYPISSEQITYNDNKNTSASLTLSQSDGMISYSYTLGSDSYSGSFTPKTDANQISMSILSRARKSVLDNVGMTLNVQNTTNLELVITVKNDDTVNPRFELGTKSGQVNIVK